MSLDSGIDAIVRMGAETVVTPAVQKPVPQKPVNKLPGMLSIAALIGGVGLFVWILRPRQEPKTGMEDVEEKLRERGLDPSKFW